MTSIDWSLTWRMLLAIAVLSALTFVLAAGVYVVGFLFTLLGTADLQLAAVGGLVACLGLLATTAYGEYRQIADVERLTDARIVDAKEFPHLHALVERVASQLGVPTPTVALTERDVPEAMVVGVRPNHTTLILSYGTLGALDDAELETVVAHELAHVRNWDAAVMTVLSTPAIVAAGIRENVRRTDEPESESAAGADHYPESAEPEPYGPGELYETEEDEVDDDSDSYVVRIALLVVATLTLLCSRPVLALLSRERERQADEVAARATGQPSDLASALRTLDRRIADTPTSDLRTAASVSSLSVLPLDPSVAAEVGIEREANETASVPARETTSAPARETTTVSSREATGASTTETATASTPATTAPAGSSPATERRASDPAPSWLQFQTHPSTEERIRRLESIGRELA